MALIGTIIAPNDFAFKNRIINGDMRIDQRNAGALVNPAITNYTVDRWYYYQSQTSKGTIGQNAGAVTPPVGFTNYLGFTSTSAYSINSTDQFFIQQAIEGLNVADLGWGTANATTVTLSFYVRSSLTGTFGGAFQNNASNRNYPFSYTINAANTWEQKSITVAGDTTGTWLTTNGAGIKVIFSLGTGATYSATAGAWTGSSFITSATGATSVVGTNGATFYITGVQLEAGSVASPFERRDIGRELALCQRYYYRVTGATGGYSTFGAGHAISTTEGRISVHYPVTMRATPTISYTGTVYLTAGNGNGTTVTSIATQYGSESGGMLAVGVASGLTLGQGTLFMTAASSGNIIQASAEL